MSQAAALMSRGQRLLAEQLPAVITIAGQAYDAATSGLRRQQDLVTGGWLDRSEVTFWVRVAAFELAGQPVPAGRAFVRWNDVDYVAEVTTDPTGATVILHAKSPEE